MFPFTSSGVLSWINRFAALQHGHVLFDPARTRLGLLGGLNAIQDRVTIMPIEQIEHAPGSRISIERGLQIRRNLGPALRRIGSIETAIEFGLLDFFQSRWLHPSDLDKCEHPLSIHLRPIALWAPRCESNQPIVRVEPVPLAVDPSVAKSPVDCFLLRDARDVCRRFRELQPNTL